MTVSQDHAPPTGSVTSGQPAAACEPNVCPLCGETVAPPLEPTEDGAEWLGQCVACNAIVETL